MYKIILKGRPMLSDIPNLFAFIFILTEAKLKLSYCTELVVEERVLKIYRGAQTSAITYPILMTSCSYRKVSLVR